MKRNSRFILTILFLFLFAASGFCDVAEMGADSGHQCVACCYAGCCMPALPADNPAISLVPSAAVVQFDSTLPQYLLIRSIEYPPKTFI